MMLIRLQRGPLQVRWEALNRVGLSEPQISEQTRTAAVMLASIIANQDLSMLR